MAALSIMVGRSGPVGLNTASQVTYLATGLTQHHVGDVLVPQTLGADWIRFMTCICESAWGSSEEVSARATYNEDDTF